MSGVLDAWVILIDGEDAWSSSEPEHRFAVGAGLRQVTETGKAIWIEAGLESLLFPGQRLPPGPPPYFAAHPITLTDGSIPGVLAASGAKPSRYDAQLAGRLNDLADFLGCAWERSSGAKAREMLRQEGETTAAEFAAVIKALPVALVMFDREYRILTCSPSWAEGMGTTDADAVGKHFSIVAPDAFARARAQFDLVLQGETFTSIKSLKPQSCSEPNWVSVDMAPWRQPDGQIGGVIVSTHDITGMVKAMEAASRSEERLTLAMEVSGIHVWEMDYLRRELIKVGGEETFFTEAASYEDLYRNPFSTIDPRDRPRVQAAWARQSQSNDVFKQEYRMLRSDEKEVWTANASRLITDLDGKPLRLIGAMQNITERKVSEAALLEAKEAAEAASHAKSAFLAAMSHEIRTPLNGVLGMAQAMAAGELSTIQAERLDVIRRSGENLLTILNDILDISKIEAGKLELESVEFDLSELARSVEALYSDIARGKGIYIEVTIQEAVRGTYLGDVTRARQILQNLVSNAIKFTEFGGVQVKISAHESGLEFVVSDTGIGVPADRVPMLFEKFEQADVSTTRRFGGTGLGLAICRELAELFNGSIRATSVVGEGTSFFVFLPLQRIGDECDASGSVSGGERTYDELEKLRVLAAEDNTVNQLVLRTLLNQAGVDPIIVSNGLEAVAAWRDREWDVILMDVRMPVMDGLEASRKIRLLENQLGRKRTPIIALTANAMSHQLAEYMEAGMQSLVAKPIDVEKLFSAIQFALDSPEAAAA